MKKFLLPSNKAPAIIPTAESLSKEATSYLCRFAASEHYLRRVLQNRLRRAVLGNPSFAEDQAAQKNLHAAID
jgi:hypothetical protein